MNESDDLFLDDPLMQALLAPGTSSELSGEGAALDAFRASRRTGNRRRHLRLITGSGSVVVALALTGGVAAAYTDSLPRTLQIAAHTLLGHLSVPAPAPAQHAERADRTAGGGRHPTSASSPRPSSLPSAFAAPAPAPAPAAQAGPKAVVDPAPRPSATAPAPAAATPSPPASPMPAPVFRAKASATTVRVHTGLAVGGALTRAGKPLADRTVYAVERVAGVEGSKRVAHGTTASDGSVSLLIPALTRNVTLTLVTGGGVASNAVRVTVLPKVTTTVRRTGGTYTATATADGGQQGDTAVLQRYQNGGWVNVSSKKLTADKTVTFSVPVPTATDRRYRVKVSATTIHGQALGPFTARTG